MTEDQLRRALFGYTAPCLAYLFRKFLAYKRQNKRRFSNLSCNITHFKEHKYIYIYV